MTLMRKAATGAAWGIILGLASRAVGLVGTLVITHHLAPAVVGEVAAASLLAFTANWLTAWGFNQYVVVHHAEGRSAVFHATVLQMGLGAIGLGAVLALGPHFTELLNAPHLMEYLPGMIIMLAIRRISAVPDKLLMVQMRFRRVAIANAIGELTYVALAVGLVVNTDLGGLGIVYANIAQALVVATIEIHGTGLAQWLTPYRLEWPRIRQVMRFGAPLAVETVLHESFKQWDKLLFARLFGTGQMGQYSLAYNLADLPATYVGEHVAAVVFPTVVNVEPARRHAVLADALAMLFMAIAPMAFGLLAVAQNLVRVLLPPTWHDVGAMLMVLSAMSLLRPVNSVLNSYLMGIANNRILMYFEAIKTVTVLLSLWLLSPFGPVAAAGALGIALAGQAFLYTWFLHNHGMQVGPMLLRMGRSVLAAAGMAAAVWLVDIEVLAPLGTPGVLRLCLQVLVGAVSYAVLLPILAPADLGRAVAFIRERLAERRQPRAG
jgi:O-antigen/teichoic acid export membrane protein